MIEVELKVGGRKYRVACQPGEEAHLQAAATLLDTQASKVVEATSRAPESQILLLSGLMLADDIKEMEWQVKSDRERARELENRLRSIDAQGQQNDDSRAEILALKRDLNEVSAALKAAEGAENDKSNHVANIERELQRKDDEIAALQKSLSEIEDSAAQKPDGDELQALKDENEALKRLIRGFTEAVESLAQA